MPDSRVDQCGVSLTVREQRLCGGCEAAADIHEPPRARADAPEEELGELRVPPGLPRGAQLRGGEAVQPAAFGGGPRDLPLGSAKGSSWRPSAAGVSGQKLVENGARMALAAQPCENANNLAALAPAGKGMRPISRK